MNQITIPAGTELYLLMPANTFQELLDWMTTNNVNPWAATLERPITISDTIDRWEVVDHTGSDWPIGLSRREHTLAEGEEWSQDGEFAKAIHHVTTPTTTPLPDHLVDAITRAVRS